MSRWLSRMLGNNYKLIVVFMSWRRRDCPQASSTITSPLHHHDKDCTSHDNSASPAIDLQSIKSLARSKQFSSQHLATQPSPAVLTPPCTPYIDLAYTTSIWLPVTQSIQSHSYLSRSAVHFEENPYTSSPNTRRKW